MSIPSTPSIPSGVWFLRVLRAFARREAQIVAGYRVSFLMRGVTFAFSILALAFMARLVGSASNAHLAPYGGNYMAFAVIGFVVMDFQQVGVTNLSSRIRTAQVLGVLEAEMATPAPPWIVLGVGPVYEFGLATLRATAYFVLSMLVFGVHFPRANVLSVIIAAPLVMGAFVGLGLLSAAATMLVRRNNPVAMILASASLLLSGVAYPLSVLPPWLRAVGNVLPLTHALELVRGALLRGAGPSELAASIGVLALFSGILVPAGAGLFVFALRRARIDGSLGHY